ncbi:hypothetical protein [Gracilimonas sp. BCB1]|uniref:hypothetical protein n=1 Tax=Gracilimonas sp. BCB1 TaxID=3152362 RepID=UPI0032D940BE
MTFQFLPNFFKKIGLFIFVATGIPAFKKGYTEGRNAARGIENPDVYEVFTFWGFRITEPIYNILAVIGIFGLLLYLFSKDKKMDEFLTRIRFEALQVTFVLSALIIFLFLVFEPAMTINAQLLLEGQVILFLIINKAKKQWALPGDRENYE